MILIRGTFYEFHSEKVVSAPGQNLEKRVGLEIGPQITREIALSRVKAKRNVYTLAKEDAYKLALQVSAGKPVHEIHIPRDANRQPRPSPTGRLDVYFRHYHPGDDHDNFGHIFFGQRGERYDTAH